MQSVCGGESASYYRVCNHVFRTIIKILILYDKFFFLFLNSLSNQSKLDSSTFPLLFCI